MSDWNLSPVLSPGPPCSSPYSLRCPEEAHQFEDDVPHFASFGTTSCSDEPDEGGFQEAVTVVAAVGRVMPSNYPSKVSHFAGGRRFAGSGQA